MKAAGLRNALIFLLGGLISWALLVWLPHKELSALKIYLGRTENLPPITEKLYHLNEWIFGHRYSILFLFLFSAGGYYFFWSWADAKKSRRMIIHNILILVLLLLVYGLLIFSMLGIRVALRGITG